MSEDKPTKQDQRPFWEAKTLDQMSPNEWEQLCDHCGLCCIVRIQDEDSDAIFDTRVICSQYDCDNTRCSSYGNRESLDEGCVELNPALVRAFDWLPDSCAYRVVDRGDSLPSSHPLISGRSDTMINVVELYEPMGGLVKNAATVDPEQYLMVGD